jgi:hypothetical protein
MGSNDNLPPGVHSSDIPGNDSTFEEWMRYVDQEIGEVCGLGHRDLPDANYRDWFDDEMTPHEAALEALEAAGFGE